MAMSVAGGEHAATGAEAGAPDDASDVPSPDPPANRKKGQEDKSGETSLLFHSGFWN